MSTFSVSWPSRIALAVVVALVVGLGLRAYDMSNGTEWLVSPAQIAAARASGKQGVESQPGTVTVLPIRSETADILPFKWAFAGLAAGVLVVATTRKRRLVR